MTKKKRDYSSIDWSEYFKVDNESPSGLVRIKSKWGNPIEKETAGSQVLEKNGDSRGWSLMHKGTTYMVHRVIWVLEHGCIDPLLVIDHLNGNPSNNTLSNLSLKTHRDNLRNQRQHKSNTSGITGVNLMVSNRGYDAYIARWVDVDGKRRSKCFSVLKFGDNEARILALEYRKLQIQRLITEGADYTERHGI